MSAQETLQRGTELELIGRLPWHKPEVQQLVVSIDTREAKNGSAEDAGAFNFAAGGGPD